jgi:acetyl esterase/lipase
VTEIHHPFEPADRPAMDRLRAVLAAQPGPMTRESFDRIGEQVPAAEGVSYSEARMRGVPGVWCTPASRSPDAAMLYLHGGVYMLGSARGFRHFAGQIAARAGLAAFVADYRLAPEHAFPAALEDARAALRGLMEGGARRVAIVGDSAGGALALTLLREAGREAACGVLLSPWTDLALGGQSIDGKAAEDPILSRAILERGAHEYLKGHDARDPLASPAHAARAALAPVQVHVGTAEVLLDDARRLADDGAIELHVWEGMPHVFPRSVAMFEAARSAMGILGDHLRRHTAGGHA